jgi:Cdc6-like AAA superfamily ATPase
MITDLRVFENEHLPQRLLHREAATAQLIGALDPQKTRRNTLLSGASGVGKTTLAKVCLRDLAAERGLWTAHARALGAAAGTVLRSVIEQLPTGPHTVPSNQPVADVRHQLRNVLEEPTAVVLDEADDVALEAVDTLLRMQHVTVVVVCHDPVRWRSRAAQQAGPEDRFGSEIQLDRFGVDELADILERRAEAGLRDGVGPDGDVPRKHLERIADDVAGVTRAGIQTLRAAAELAEEREHRCIREPDVDDAHARARRTIREANLESLPFSHRFLYALIRRHGEVSSEALWERYDEVASDAWNGRLDTPPTRRARRDHLQKLREYDLVATADNRTHTPVDSDLAAGINIS